MDKRAYWIWLQHAFGAGSQKPWSIFNRFSSGIEEFYEGGAPLWNSMKFISEKEARMLLSFSVVESEAMLELSEKLKHDVITPECEKYPEALRNIFDPPAVLYCKGELPDVDETPTITVVGARKASERGVEAATKFGYQLAISGAVTVSGGAVGIDTAAIKGALRGMGKVISVLPCGLSNGYIIENFLLRERIAEEGALVTEYPMSTDVTKGTFQVRNRLLSGLSCGTLIVEAAEKSGALITARHAKEQSRDVFAFPSENYPEQSKASAGSDALIKDGAKPVYGAEEILLEYTARFRKAPRKPKKKKAEIAENRRAPVMAEPDEYDDLNEDAKKLLFALTAEPKHLNMLEEETGLSAGELLAAVTELELMGKIKPHSGRRYSL